MSIQSSFQVSIDMQITDISNHNNKPTFEPECYNIALCKNHSIKWNMTGDRLKDNASFYHQKVKTNLRFTFHHQSQIILCMEL